MAEDTKQTKEEVVEKKEEAVNNDPKKETTQKKAPAKKGGFSSGAPKKDFRGRRRTRRPQTREEREYDQKVIDIRRVTRVMAGGRRFSFSVSMVMGNKKGQVGVGVGKASDTSLAIQKAGRNAKKNMIKLNLPESKSIPHEVSAKFCSAKIMIKPTGTDGLIAGSSVRNVLELAGVKGVSAKVLSRSKNKLNNARATIKALKMTQ